MLDKLRGEPHQNLNRFIGEEGGGRGLENIMTNRSRQRRGELAKLTVFSVWIAAVSIVLLWQASHYTGIMAVFSEWQYNAIGRHYPTFNYVLLIFLAGLPGYLLFFRPRKRSSVSRDGYVTVRSARVFMRALFGTAAGLAIACLVVLAASLFLPNGSGPLQQIALSQSVGALPHEGLTVLSGQIIYERTAGYDEDLIVTRHNSRYAPIVAPGDPSRDLQFFVQLPPVNDGDRSGTSSMTGILKQDGLPGALIRLFRYAGYRVQDPHFVLFADAATMRWPYLLTAFQLGFGALLAAAVGLLQKRRVTRLRVARKSLPAG
jgi:hypothetical protein